MTRRAGRLAATLAAAAVALPVLLIAGFELLVAALPMPSLARFEARSPVVLAEDGAILTARLSPDGAWRLPARPDEVPSLYRDMLLRYEDRRFYEHGGVDWLAAGRAFGQMLAEGRVVSGASTLTMQTVRLLDGQQPGLLGKLRQAALAVKLERSLGKERILSIYLTLAPFGGNIEGVRMASLQYFGKEPRALTVAEAALLVALPQAPELRRPDLHPEAARRARDRVLLAMAAAGVMPPALADAAVRAPLPAGRGAWPWLAQHLADRLLAAEPGAAEIRTLIDRRLQAGVEAAARDYVARQPDAANIAVVVVRNADGAVRAYVGGGAYLDAERAGMVDLAAAVRSPGSALKPVIYGLAFERLLVHPETVVTDDITRLGAYAPENFDRTYRGDLTVRDALIASVNTVPVQLLSAVGAERFIGRLRDAGIAVALPDPAAPPGLAVALGGLGISLEELAATYSGIAGRGLVRPLRYRPEQPAGQPRRLLSDEAAWAVADILADVPPPEGRAPERSADGGRRIAHKTGTSYGFRDAWSIGFDAGHTVAVWVGRPDGASRPGETGTSAAVPVMYQAFALLPVPARDVAAGPPADSILGRHGPLPPRLQRFPPAAAPDGAFAPEQPFAIAFPLDGATVSLARDGSARLAPLTITTRGGRGPFRWFIDGSLLPAAAGTSLTWTPPGPGAVDIRVRDADGRQAAAAVWLD